ncbi:phage holin [Gottfriedia sp. S16(2024)]|uniref:holin n=1 Tax=Gottfriedia sp. S16(2024) TaxID=3162883 RepID=UPI003D1DCE93
MKIPARFKNVGLWVSAASSVLIIAQAFGLHVSPDKYNEVLNAVLSLLVVLGILNNPTTDNKFYGDDKHE